MRRTHSMKHGFTLIELLVVISIIALLIAILLPALKSARDSAQAIACASNLRQFGITATIFSNDHDGHLLAAHDNRLIPGVSGKNHIDQSWNIVARYVTGEVNPKDTKMFLCPADPRTKRSYKENFRASYAGNGRITLFTNDGPAAIRAAKLLHFRQPSLTFYYGPDWLRGTSTTYTSRYYAGQTGGHAPILRHPNDTGNFLFLDGHVEAVSSSPPASVPGYDSKELGSPPTGYTVQNFWRGGYSSVGDIYP